MNAFSYSIPLTWSLEDTAQAQQNTTDGAIIVKETECFTKQGASIEGKTSRVARNPRRPGAFCCPRTPRVRTRARPPTRPSPQCRKRPRTRSKPVASPAVSVCVCARACAAGALKQAKRAGQRDATPKTGTVKQTSLIICAGSFTEKCECHCNPAGQNILKRHTGEIPPTHQIDKTIAHTPHTAGDKTISFSGICWVGVGLSVHGQNRRHQHHTHVMSNSS